MRVDVAVIGAGPVGLCFTRALAAAGLSVALVDKQSMATLRDPVPDGREIALHHASQAILKALDIWHRLPADAISPLRDARVFNGDSPFAMTISSGRGDSRQPLGVLVPNYRLRQAAFDAVAECDGVVWHEAALQRIDSDSRHARLWLDDGTRLEADLAVAADSRFSEARRQMGIGAEMCDNGRSMLVCRMQHDKAHDQSAWEWFDHGQTLALLPLGPHESSVVVTLPKREMESLTALDDETFSTHIAARFDYRLGDMRKQGEPAVYPLVSTYAHRFVARRFALVGDAAVGMHPVTAHGFNLGLQGQQELARRVIVAHRQAQDIGGRAVLGPYERHHRLATGPLYVATQAIVSLYTDDRPPARLLRHAGLRLAERVTPLKMAIAHHLTRQKPPIS